MYLKEIVSLLTERPLAFQEGRCSVGFDINLPGNRIFQRMRIVRILDKSSAFVNCNYLHRVSCTVGAFTEVTGSLNKSNETKQ
jgi:hypothetical protein